MSVCQECQQHTIASKCLIAAPFPPLPSQFFLPLPMKPVVKFSQRFSVAPDSSHFQSAGFGEIFLPLSS
jgi:hypothetical protein